MSTSGEYPPARQCFNQYCPSLCDLKEAKFSDSKILLCTQCFELYSRKKCCYFCAQVYKDDEQNFLDGKKWVQCDNGKCGKWTHIDCEEPNIEQQLQNKRFVYRCPWCRIEKQQKKTAQLPKIPPRENSDQEDYVQPPPIRKIVIDESSISTFEPCVKKNTFLDELLKKNGEFQQSINQDEYQSDLLKMRTLVKQ